MSYVSCLELRIVGASSQLQELEGTVPYGYSLELGIVGSTSQLHEVEGKMSSGSSLELRNGVGVS